MFARGGVGWGGSKVTGASCTWVLFLPPCFSPPSKENRLSCACAAAAASTPHLSQGPLHGPKSQEAPICCFPCDRPASDAGPGWIQTQARLPVAPKARGTAGKHLPLVLLGCFQGRGREGGSPNSHRQRPPQGLGEISLDSLEAHILTFTARQLLLNLEPGEVVQRK